MQVVPSRSNSIRSQDRDEARKWVILWFINPQWSARVARELCVGCLIDRLIIMSIKYSSMSSFSFLILFFEALFFLLVGLLVLKLTLGCGLAAWYAIKETNANAPKLLGDQHLRKIEHLASSVAILAHLAFNFKGFLQVIRYSINFVEKIICWVFSIFVWFFFIMLSVLCKILCLEKPACIRRYGNNMQLCVEALDLFNIPDIDTATRTFWKLRLIFSVGLGCFLIQFYEDVETVEQLNSWYSELSDGKFDRLLLLKPAFKDETQKANCPSFVARNLLGLKKENFDQLRSFGLNFVLIKLNIARVPSWFPVGFAFENMLLEFMLYAKMGIYRRSIFLSHRWGADKTWHGIDGWQFKKSLDYLFGNPALCFMWIDGLCAPQEDKKLTMVVIDNLPTIIRQCKFFVCIDGSFYGRKVVPQDELYFNRVWCLYELFLRSCPTKMLHTFCFKQPDKPVEIIFPDNLELPSFDESDKENIIELLLRGFVFDSADKVQIILNILGIPKVSQENCTQSSLRQNMFLKWNELFDVDTFFVMRFSYFPFATLIALTILFHRFECQHCWQQNHLPCNVSLENNANKSLLVPEILYFAERHWYRNLFGFQVYFVEEIFELQFLRKINIVICQDIERGAAPIQNICCHFMFNVWGMNVFATLVSLEPMNCCFINFREWDTDRIKNISDQNTWWDWNAETQARLQSRNEGWLRYSLL